MNNEKISPRQLWIILFLIRSIIIVSDLPVLTSGNALQDAWISAILLFFTSEIFVILITVLDLKFPDKNLIEYTEEIFGKWGGKIFSLLFIFIFIQFAVIETRLYGELLTTYFLPHTPILVIAGSILIVAIFCVYQGIEVLARTADFLFLLMIIAILGIIFIPLGYVDLINLQPVFVRGWKPIFSGVITPTSYISQIWVLGMLSINVTGKKRFLIPITSIGTSLLILIIISAITVGVVGAYPASRSTFPILTLLRSVKATNFLQRTEALIIFGWGMGFFIALSTYLYCGAKSLSQVLNLKNYKITIIPLSILILYLSLYVFEDIFTLYKYISPENYYINGIIFLIVPLTFLWLGYGLKSLVKLDGGNNEN
ncbi:MAG: GerAB/ArcD/ProY family transporter [Bacillota bacterium]